MESEKRDAVEIVREMARGLEGRTLKCERDGIDWTGDRLRQEAAALRELLDRLATLQKAFDQMGVNFVDAVKDVNDLRSQLAKAEARAEAAEKERDLEKASGDCIMEIRASLHARFGDEVDAAFFDDVVDNAIVLGRREVERELSEERAKRELHETAFKRAVEAATPILLDHGIAK